MQNVKQAGGALGTCSSALPYVQSREELGQLVNAYNQYLATTQNAPVNILSGSTQGHGAPAPFSPYQVGFIPALTGTEHGSHGGTVDTGGMAQSLQRAVDAYRQRLPGADLSTNVAMTPEQSMRLWTQFLDRANVLPSYSPKGWEGTSIETGAGEGTSQMSIPGFGPGLQYNINPGTTGAYAPSDTLIRYGEPGYDYALAGAPKPGEYFGSVNPIWSNLVGGGAGPQGQGFASLGTNSSPGAPAGAGQAGGQKSNLQGTLGFAGLTGPLNEIRGGDNPNQI